MTIGSSVNEARLLERTYKMLEEPLLGDQDVDTKVRRLLEAEYLRRLAAYHHVDRTLSHKYGMSFQAFVDHRVAEQRGFTADVEADAMDWETAVSGIDTIERKLRELREFADVQHG
jgi:hypothetical protein